MAPSSPRRDRGHAKSVGILLTQWDGADEFVVPAEPMPALAHAPNFERWDGFDPLVNNDGSTDLGFNYGTKVARPGQLNQPIGQEFTRSSLGGLTNTLGGQPLPVADWLYRVGRGYTPSSGAAHPQWRLGVGQNYQGVAQTAQLADITNNPPVPDDLSSIISGWG